MANNLFFFLPLCLSLSGSARQGSYRLVRPAIPESSAEHRPPGPSIVLLGGFLAAKDGLKKWIWFMIIAINLPDAVYIYLAHYQPDNFLVVNLCIGIETFGYGFGFTAYMLYMIYISEGDYKTVHFAITTGFMALGMMIPGMFSGYIQEFFGYENFFIWVLICAIPGFLLLKFLPIDPEFGKKKQAVAET